MAVFHVWAPAADEVAVTVQGRSVPMSSAAGGWWIAEVALAGSGADYAFSVDGGPPLPDPRSGWQPQGVHAASRLVDHGAFRWTDAGFQPHPLPAALVYELHVGTFTPEGTFAAAIGKLDHLRDLGVSHVELMPVADFPGRFGWGYDGVALYAPRHVYGGPEGLKRLVDACHARGLGVILDVVYNHLGPSGNYLPQFGPYLSERHKTPWGSALNFDGPESDEVRRFVCDNALSWFRDYHVDGLRLDAVHAIVDTSAVHLLEQLAAEVDALEAHLGRHLVLIAESNLNDPRIVRPPEIGGYGIDAHWSDDFHHALHTVLTGERTGYYADFGSIADLATALGSGYVYTGQYSAFRRCCHGRPPTGLSAHRFLGYSQTHDQVGNRAQGDRLIHQCGLECARLAAALVLTAPFVPLLFQGEEFGATAPFVYFADFADDLGLSRAVTEGRRHEFAAFGWKPEDVPDPAAPATFARSKLDWSEREREPHRSLFQWYRQLVQLRRRVPQLSDGRLEQVATAFSEAEQWLVYERSDVTVAVNFAAASRAIPLRADRPRSILLRTHEGGIDVQSDRVTLPGRALVILGPPRYQGSDFPR
jgi:maltooligosyltrehalose trehalohydrolase